MDDKTQRERLEQELRFLKESFEADVISREEYEKGKDRIEKKLKEIKLVEKEQINEETKKEKPEKQEKIEETKDVEAIESKEGKKIKLNVIQDETFEEQQQEQIQVTEQKESPEAQEPKIEIKEDKNEGKFFKYAIVFIVLALIIFFSYSLLKPTKIIDFRGTENQTNVSEFDELTRISQDFLVNKKEAQEKIMPSKFVAACNSGDDCKQEGKIGICVAPGTKDAKCEFKVSKSNIVVLNDRKNCFNCDTQRVLGILESWLGAISVKEIDYNTEKGKELAEKFNAKMLPMYILDENITKKPSFEQIKQTIMKKDNSYILSEDAAGSTFYFKRDNIANKIELFVIAGDEAAIKAENNLKEFLDAFAEAKFEKHFSNDKLAQELGIKTFPTFLINNKVRFSGINSAETIKENFCRLNKLKECEKNLSKSLV
ncbi:hypothetical protein J4448_04235 [Candidatus Woesearchaeota archaeon]|nr:hypothetical protein [Candidatus Woesearchaeota archaeon]